MTRRRSNPVHHDMHAGLTSTEFMTRLSQLETEIDGLMFPGAFRNVKYFEVKFEVADEDKELFHGSGKVTKKYLLLGQDAAGSIYDGKRPTENSIYLKCDTADTTARILVIW